MTLKFKHIMINQNSRYAIEHCMLIILIPHHSPLVWKTLISRIIVNANSLKLGKNCGYHGQILLDGALGQDVFHPRVYNKPIRLKSMNARWPIKIKTRYWWKTRCNRKIVEEREESMGRRRSKKGRKFSRGNQ